MLSEQTPSDMTVQGNRIPGRGSKSQGWWRQCACMGTDQRPEGQREPVVAMKGRGQTAHGPENEEESFEQIHSSLNYFLWC